MLPKVGNAMITISSSYKEDIDLSLVLRQWDTHFMVRETCKKVKLEAKHGYLEP